MKGLPLLDVSVRETHVTRAKVVLNQERLKRALAAVVIAEMNRSRTFSHELNPDNKAVKVDVKLSKVDGLGHAGFDYQAEVVVEYDHKYVHAEVTPDQLADPDPSVIRAGAVCALLDPSEEA